MDTPTIAAYYREADPMKRKRLLEKSIADGEDVQANAVRKELWEIRYREKSDAKGNERADGFLGLWMELEFNRGADKKWFAIKRARKEISRRLEELRFAELIQKSDLHRELLYRECCHLIWIYMDLCEKDKAYSNVLFGLVSMSDERTREKIQSDILQTAVKLPAALQMEEELDLIIRAAKEMYEERFPGEGGIG